MSSPKRVFLAQGIEGRTASTNKKVYSISLSVLDCEQKLTEIIEFNEQSNINQKVVTSATTVPTEFTKIRAQRKFAQGAIIPPSQHGIEVVTQSPQQPKPPPPPLFEHISVHELVNFICMRGLTSKVPTLLHPIQNESFIKDQKPTIEPILKEQGVNKEQREKRPIVLVNKCTIPFKETKVNTSPKSPRRLAGKQGMSLRNRTIKELIPKTKLAIGASRRLGKLSLHNIKKPKERGKKKVVFNIKKTKLVRKYKQITNLIASEFSSEDETPLKLIGINKKRVLRSNENGRDHQVDRRCLRSSIKSNKLSYLKHKIKSKNIILERKQTQTLSKQKLISHRKKKLELTKDQNLCNVTNNISEAEDNSQEPITQCNLKLDDNLASTKTYEFLDKLNVKDHTTDKNKTTLSSDDGTFIEYRSSFVKKWLDETSKFTADSSAEPPPKKFFLHRNNESNEISCVSKIADLNIKKRKLENSHTLANWSKVDETQKECDKSKVYEFHVEPSPPEISTEAQFLKLPSRLNNSPLKQQPFENKQDLFFHFKSNDENKLLQGKLVKSELGVYVRCKLVPKTQGMNEELNDIKKFQFQNIDLDTTGPETSNNLVNDLQASPCPQVAKTPNFPDKCDSPQLVEAPVFTPTEIEFQDPLEYIEKIKEEAEKFGICKIIPPSSFKPECHLSDDIRFTAYNQYLHRMLNRWGPSTFELCAIKKYLATQSVSFKRPPLIGGIEADLPQLYRIVQSMGGLKEVIQKKKWGKVAEEMKLPKSAQLSSRLDEIYVKYLLPYTTLSDLERLSFFESVERNWIKKYKKMLHRAKNPNLYYSKLLLPESLSNSDSDSDDDALEETEECVTKGRSLSISGFLRIATNAMQMWFPQSGEGEAIPSPIEVENSYWNHIQNRSKHVCVNAASIDSGVKGYGFPNSKLKNTNLAKHPWNLKVLTNNNRSILRSLGRVMGVTVPTIHVGMVFSSCCWYRDPHSLPWIEYHHSGATKIWYGVPDEHSDNFRAALQKIVPNYCQNKKIWLPSDMTMVPPSMLLDNGVSLCRTEQKPGEFIVVFPKAFTSSICTGYVVTESVYFAPFNWLQNVYQIFQDIRESCEPTIFSLEQLLISIIFDTKASQEVLSQTYDMFKMVIQAEEFLRDTIKGFDVRLEQMKKKAKITTPLIEECYVCRCTLFLSKVVDLISDGTMICLHHAVQVLNSGNLCLEDKTPALIYTHSMEELYDMLKKLESRIIIKK